MSSTALRAVLLDVDGTLLDSNDAHARAWIDALAESGRTVAFDAVRRLIGKGGDKLLPEVTGIDVESEEGTRLAKRRGAIFADRYLPRLQPFPGTRSLLERMKADGLALVVATSAKDDELTGLLERAGVADLIEQQATSDDADASKPDPDIVVAALKKARRAATECVMLGDTPYDVAAATGAGVRVIAFRCGGWHDAELHGALAVYDGPADLLAGYDDAPALGSARSVAARSGAARSGAARSGAAPR